MKIHWLFVLLLSTFSFGQQANCLSASVQKNMEWADAVFAGEVTFVSEIDHDEPLRVIVTFSVSQYWKGDFARELNWKGDQLSKEVRLYAFARDFTGMSFREGMKYLVYSKKYSAKYWLGRGVPLYLSVLFPQPEDLVYMMDFCLRPGVLKDLGEDLKILGEPKVFK